MTPLEFMTRLAALVAPPRHPLIRFHGVLAPHANWRPEVVPRKADGAAACSVATLTHASKPSPAHVSSPDVRSRDERKPSLATLRE